MTRAQWLLICGVMTAACGGDPVQSGPRTVRMRVVVEPTPATAVLLRVTGPAGIGLVGDRTDLLVEALQSSAQVVLAAFGASVTGPVARVTGVEVGEAGAISVQVVDAVGADHRSLPVGVVTARIVVDTVQ